MYYVPDDWRGLRLCSEVRPLFLDTPSPRKYDLPTLAEQVSVRRVHRYTQSSILPFSPSFVVLGKRILT
jgi:hypothetical protein